MQVLLRDCVPEPQVTLQGLHSDHGGLPGGRSPIVRSKITIIIIIIIIIIIMMMMMMIMIIIIIKTEIVIIRIDASS